MLVLTAICMLGSRGQDPTMERCRCCNTLCEQNGALENLQAGLVLA